MSADHRCCPTDAGPAHCVYEPTGETLYLAGPLDAKVGVLLISDIFGMHNNTKHTVDELAAAGYLVAMPDFFGKKVITEADMAGDKNTPKMKTFFELIAQTELHQAKAERAIALLRKLGCQKIAALGLCWGSVVAMSLSAQKKIDAVLAAHPSRLTPEVVAGTRTPICILAAVDDPNMDAIHAAVQALTTESKLFKQYKSVHHGYLGARFDFVDAPPEQKTERADAMASIIEFLTRTL